MDKSLCQGATADLDSKGMKTVALTQVAPIVGHPESLQNSRSSKNSSKQPSSVLHKPPAHTLRTRTKMSRLLCPESGLDGPHG